MPEGPLTYGELAAVMDRCAGVSVDGRTLASTPMNFEQLGVDSLGVMGIVAELSRLYRRQFGADADQSSTPHELLAVINSEIDSGG